MKITTAHISSVKTVFGGSAGPAQMEIELDIDEYEEHRLFCKIVENHGAKKIIAWMKDDGDPVEWKG